MLQVSQAVKWLVAHSSAASPLTSQTLVDFVEAGLCHEFSSRLYQDKQDRAQARLSCQDPAPIIELYNSVLHFLAGLVSSEQLSNLSWPPAEFSLPETRDLLPHLNWNAPSHLLWLKRAILSLQLPEWDLPPLTGEPLIGVGHGRLCMCGWLQGLCQQMCYIHTVAFPYFSSVYKALSQ